MSDLTNEELRALADFFNDDNYSMPNDLYDRIGKKLLVQAAKAGLYDEGGATCRCPCGKPGH